MVAIYKFKVTVRSTSDKNENLML